jgi:hypothetical protein
MDLVSDPVATVEGVYQHFGMQLPTDAAKSIERYVSEKPNGGYGRRDYHFEDHGLDAQTESDKFKPYLLRFGIASEVRPGARHRSGADVKQSEVAGSISA